MPEFLWSLIKAPWSLAPDTLLGAALLAVIAALAGEAVWRVLRWPRLVGYVIVGTALALSGRGASGDEPALRPVIDVALGLLLFEAGARLRLRWLVSNPWLLATSVAESLLTGIVVFIVLSSFGLGTQVAAPLAIVAVCVSPAVLQRVVGELHAAGQVTERLLALAALNTLYAVLAMKLLSAGLLPQRSAHLARGAVAGDVLLLRLDPARRRARRRAGADRAPLRPAQGELDRAAAVGACCWRWWWRRRCSCRPCWCRCWPACGCATAASGRGSGRATSAAPAACWCW